MARGYFLYSKYSRFSKKSLTLVNSKLVLVQAPHGVTLLVTGLEIREGVTKEENMLSVIQNTQLRPDTGRGRHNITDIVTQCLLQIENNYSRSPSVC